MATMASSTSLPMVGSLADPWRWDQRASAGTQKTFSARLAEEGSFEAADLDLACMIRIGMSGYAPWLPNPP